MIARWGFLISERHLPHNCPKIKKSRPTNSPKNVIELCSSMLLKNEFSKFSQCASASVMFPNWLHWRQSILKSQNSCVFKCGRVWMVCIMFGHCEHRHLKPSNPIPVIFTHIADKIHLQVCAERQ